MLEGKLTVGEESLHVIISVKVPTPSHLSGLHLPGLWQIAHIRIQP